MDKKITARIERIGEIEALAKREQLELIEQYLKDFHGASWELLKCWHIANLGTIPKPKNSTKLIELYRKWLEKNDTAWGLAQSIRAIPRDKTWEEMSELVGKSPETCRQALQALHRGGMP